MSSAADDQSKQSVAGYPPAPVVNGYSQSYPNYPPPYQGYPPPPPYSGYPNPHYPYTAPPPATYYSQQYVPAHQEPTGRFTIARFILTMMIVLVVGAITMSLLTYLIFGSDIPTFSVQSFAVPSFNVTGHTLKADWEANITVKNSNEKLVVFFERLEGVIIYEDTVLAISTVEPFHVGTKGEATFHIKFLSEASPSQQIHVGEHPDLVRDRNREKMTFGLRMVAATSFRSSSLWRRQANLRVFCEDLQVKFAGPAGPGTLLAGNRREHECLIYA